MRVLHVIRSDGFAGVERHVARLAGQQAYEGDEVIVVGGDQRRMGAALAGRAATRNGDGLGQVITQIARLGPGSDVLHVHMTAAELGAAAGAGVLRLRGAHPPVVSTRHFARARGNGAKGAVVARVAGGVVSTQIAISHYVAAHVEGACTVVHPGVDPRPDAAAAADRRPVVLVVQRLEPEKNTDVALRAFAASGLAGAGWRLEVAGDGALRGALDRLAAELGIAAAVDFLGARDDVPELMASAAVLVAPCAIEGLGLSVLEAMAAGLPCVASAAGGHLETVPEVGGSTLFPAGDAGAAGVLLAALAADPDRRDALAAASQQRQRAEFTLAAQVAGTRAVYLDQLAR